jgi:hypothetical protein
LDGWAQESENRRRYRMTDSTAVFPTADIQTMMGAILNAQQGHQRQILINSQSTAVNRVTS